VPTHRESPVKRMNPSGKVVWKARYTDQDGRRRSAGTFKLKSDAQKAIDKAYDTRSEPLTVAAYLKVWTARYPRAQRTNVTNEGRVRQVLPARLEGRALAAWPLRDLRRRHALELVDHMLRVQGRASTGAQNILRSLSAMTEDAITDECCEVNPFKGVRVRASDVRAVKPSRKPCVLSFEEMHAFAAAASTCRRVDGRDEIVPAPRFEPMLRTLADCGLRIGELFALRRADLAKGLLHVSGSAWEGQIQASSETKNHDRDVPVPIGCLALLRSMPPRIDTPWLFATLNGRVWRVNNFYRDVWRPTRIASGLDCTPHDFRHSWVTNLRAAGVDPADLAAMAGHSVETATGRYTHALGRSFDQVRGLVG
jgi:integrase